MKRILGLVLALSLSFAALAVFMLRAFADETKREQEAWEALAQRVKRPSLQTADPGEQPNRANADRFAPLIEENADFAAWLTIPGTVIDYPVMMSCDEPEFYLTHDFSRNESVGGTPFFAAGCACESDNILIHAHNMKNGTMFAPLLSYADEEFFFSHRTILLDTPERSEEYIILAAFPEKLHTQSETEAFRYYDYAGELTAERYAEYVEKCKAASLYESGVNAEYGDRLLTLSTCAYHTEDGRFVVVAVRR